jgi:hypothetical protein
MLDLYMQMSIIYFVRREGNECKAYNIVLSYLYVLGNRRLGAHSFCMGFILNYIMATFRKTQVTQFAMKRKF